MTIHPKVGKKFHRKLQISITVVLVGEEKTVTVGRKSLGNGENKSFMSIYLIVVEIFQTGPQWRTDIVIHRAWLLELRKISSK